MYLDFLRFFLLYDNMKASYTIYLIPMENTTTIFSEERIQEARKCLEENNSEMEHMVDRIDYYTARLEILISRLHISRSDAKILLAKINTKPSVENIMEGTKNIISTTIQEVSYDDLIKEFSEAYDTFCRDREINPSFPPIE